MSSAWLASCSEKQSVCRGSCPNYSPIRRRAKFPQIQPQAVKLKKALAHVWGGGGNGCHLAWKHNLGKFRWGDTENCSIHAARRPLESPLTIMTGIQDTYLHSCTALSVYFSSQPPFCPSPCHTAECLASMHAQRICHKLFAVLSEIVSILGDEVLVSPGPRGSNFALLNFSAAISSPTWVEALLNSTLANPHSQASDIFRVEIILLETMW